MTLHDTPTLRLRADIQWSLYSDSSPRRWVARDPISLKYFYFSELEKEVVMMLDDGHSLKQIALSLPMPDAAAWLLDLLSRLEAACLLNRPVRRRRGKASAWPRWLAWAANPLAIRVPLFDPTRLLNSSAWLAQLLFCPAVAGASCLLMACTLLGVVARLLQDASALTLGPEALTATQLIILLCIYAVVKSLHEIGHALACARWEVECHEVGLLLLALMPCLYCDTTDSWKLPNRWQRAAIAAAGIYVELLIATLAGIVWLMTIPESALHILAGYIAVVCSVHTVFINANPLLKYDGYYVLSDLASVPNLAQQSAQAVDAAFTGWFTGRMPIANGSDAHRGVLLFFGVASATYRTLVLGSILWLAWHFLSQYGMGLLALLLVATTLSAYAVNTMRRLHRMKREISHAGGFRPLRVGLLMLVLGMMVWMTTMAQWPRQVTARGVTNNSSMRPVFAPEDATLRTAPPPPGTHIEQGEILATLSAPEISLELIRLEGELAVSLTAIEQLRMLSTDQPEAVLELENQQQRYQSLTRRYRLAKGDVDALTLRSNISGEVVPIGFLPTDELSNGVPANARKRPLGSADIGRRVSRGDLLCWIAESAQFSVTAYVAGRSVELLRPGASVRIRWDAAVANAVVGVVARIAPEPQARLPDILIGDRALRFGRGGESDSTIETFYSVDISLKETPPDICYQSVATVHIDAGTCTLFQYLSSAVRQSLRDDWR